MQTIEQIGGGILKPLDLDKQNSLGSIVADVYNPRLVHQVLNSYIANGHQGTKKQKNLSEVRGGGRKPFKQKGRGKARVGSLRCTIFRGGALAFPARGVIGHKPKINKKMYKGCIKSILLQLYQDKRLQLIDDISLASSKTKDFVTSFGYHNKNERHIIFTGQIDSNLELATRNLYHITVSKPYHSEEFNPVSLLRYHYIWITMSGLFIIQNQMQS